MIDWNTIDKTNPADWTRLAELLMQKSVASIQAAQRAILEEVQADLLAFVQAASNRCPAAALGAVNASARQVAAASLALDVADLQTRSARLDAAGAKVSAAAGTVREEALKLQLIGVKKVLEELNGLATEVQSLRARIDTIPKKDMPARLDAILELLTQIRQRAQTAQTG